MRVLGGFPQGLDGCSLAVTRVPPSCDPRQTNYIIPDAGLDAIGLPATYPYDAAGDLIPHNVCQPIGHAAYDAGLDGVDCRSAAIDDGRELAWFPRSRAVSETSRLPFSDWW